MTTEYVHQKLGEEVPALAGFYTLLKELRLKHAGKEILCIVGSCAIESSCCGSRWFRYAIIPGYLVTWKGKEDKAGRTVSEVEPVVDEKAKQHVARVLNETEVISIPNVEFW